MTHSSFWAARPVHAHIHDYARARRVSPWALFGAVAARIVAAVEPRVQLPPIIGAPASLNLFVALVGRSGSGKGAAMAAAHSAVRIDGMREPFDVHPLGSGEGIGASYVGYEQGEDGKNALTQHTQSVMFEVGEIDTVAALGSRQAATLMPELRKVWSGERLGFKNRGASLTVAPHSYRASLICGVQPAKAGALLNDADGGTPQRFLWMPTTGHKIVRGIEIPEPFVWNAPGEDVLPTRNGHRTLDVCQAARITIEDAYDQTAALPIDAPTSEDDELNGHALLARLKVAAVLALLDSRGRVSDEDWQLAALVMDVSDETRGACRRVMRNTEIAARRKQAEGRADATVHGNEHAELAQLQKAKAAILGKIGTDWTSRAVITRGLTKTAREVFDDAVYSLEQDAKIKIATDTYQGNDRQRFRLSTSETSPGLAASSTLDNRGITREISVGDFANPEDVQPRLEALR